MMEAIFTNVIHSFSFKGNLVLANIHVSPQPRDKKGHLHACHSMLGRDWAVFEKEFEKMLVNYFKENILPGGKHEFNINSAIQVVVRISTTSTEALLECLKSSKLQPANSIVCFDCFIDRGVSKSAKEDSAHRFQELELRTERISKKNTASEVKKNDAISAAEPFLTIPISRCTRSHDSTNNASPAKKTGGEDIASTDAKRPRGKSKKPDANEKYNERKQKKCEGDTSKELGSKTSDVDKTTVKSERSERKKANERENGQRETSKSDDKRSATKTRKVDTTENSKREAAEAKESRQLTRDAKVHGEKVTKEKSKRKKSSERDGKKYKKTRPPDENRPKEENNNQVPKVPKEDRKTAKRNQKETEKMHEALFGSFITDDEDEEAKKFAVIIEQRAIERTSADRSLKAIISDRYFSGKRDKCSKAERKKMETLDLHGLKQSEILASFDEYKHKLDKVFEAKRGPVSIDHFLVIFLVNQKMQFAMLQKLNDTYQTDPAKDHSQLLLNVMLPEWLLLLFMDRYSMSRAQAVQQLFDQDKHNALYGGDLLDFERAVRLRK